MENSTGLKAAVHAWLVPENAAAPMIPIGNESRVLGYAANCEILRLKNFCAAAEQAEIGWDGENAFVRDLSGNSLTRLNCAEVSDSCEPLYHNDVLSLADERFEVIRADGICRPKADIELKFLSEGELVETRTFKSGEAIVFPAMPQYRENSNGIMEFEGWTDESGKAAEVHDVCTKAQSYSAVYRDFKGTIRIDESEVYLTNCETYSILHVPEEGFKFGGYCCNSYFKGFDGVGAEIKQASCELTAYKDDLITVNGAALNAGSTVTLFENDKIAVQDRQYIVIGHKKSQKAPILRNSNGEETVLNELSEGKSVILGRDHQKMFNKVLFIGHDHAIIREENGKYYIKDNNSKNGTFVRKANSDSEIQLAPGAEIELENGDTVKLFIYSFVFCN